MSNFGLFPKVIWFVILDHLPQKNWRTLKVNTYFRQLMVQKSECILELWPEHYPEKKMEFIAHAGYIESFCHCYYKLKMSISEKTVDILAKQNYLQFLHVKTSRENAKYTLINLFKKYGEKIAPSLFKMYFIKDPCSITKWFAKYGYLRELKNIAREGNFEINEHYIQKGFIRAGEFDVNAEKFGDFSLFCDIMDIPFLEKNMDKFAFDFQSHTGYKLGKHGDLKKINWYITYFNNHHFRKGLVMGLCVGNHFKIFKQKVDEKFFLPDEFRGHLSTIRLYYNKPFELYIKSCIKKK